MKGCSTQETVVGKAWPLQCLDQCLLTRNTHLLLAFPKCLVLYKDWRSCNTKNAVNTPHKGREEFLVSSLELKPWREENNGSCAVQRPLV